VLIQQKLL